MMESGLMTTAEVAMLLTVDQSTVWRYVKRPENPLPCTKIGGNFQFDRSAVKKWNEERGGGLMTTAEVADLLGVSRTEIRRRRIRMVPLLPSIRFDGGTFRYNRSAVERWVREKKKEREEKTKSRRCYKCKSVKPLSEFHKSGQRGCGGHTHRCKACQQIRDKGYNSRSDVKKRKREYKKAYRQKPEVKEKERLNRKRRYENVKDNPKYRIEHYMQTAFRRALRGEDLSKRIFFILGYDAKQLRDHLKAQFKRGMTWENYGHKGWHVDHIKPQSSFNYTSMEDEEFKACWALSNLQPLWAVENLKKGSKEHNHAKA